MKPKIEQSCEYIFYTYPSRSWGRYEDFFLHEKLWKKYRDNELTRHIREGMGGNNNIHIIETNSDCR